MNSNSVCVGESPLDVAMWLTQQSVWKGESLEDVPPESEQVSLAKKAVHILTLATMRCVDRNVPSDADELEDEWMTYIVIRNLWLTLALSFKDDVRMELLEFAFLDVNRSVIRSLAFDLVSRDDLSGHVHRDVSMESFEHSREILLEKLSPLTVV